jgi:hypothetical protein
MVIDWTAAPEGTTHATTPNGDPRWYKLEGGKVLCWATRLNEWAPSFFLTVDEIADTGLRLYANGEQSELVMLREQRDALLEAAKCLRSGYVRLLEAGRDRIRDLGGECDGIDVMVKNDIELAAIDKTITFMEGNTNG